MKLALISLSKDIPDGSRPMGFQPLFDGIVLDQQIQAVMQAGAEQIILLCPTMSGAVLQYVDTQSADGLDIQMVRGGHDLVQFASPENELVYLADGILPGPKLIQQLSDSGNEAIYVAKDTEIFADFERIDQNDRWLGIARLKCSRLSGFIHLPEDWDVGSALLRGTVQSECRREVIEEKDFSAGAVSHLKNEVTVSDFSRSKLQKTNRKQGNFLQRLVIWPLTRAILPKFWKAPEARSYLGWAAFATGLTASLSVFLKLPVIASLTMLFSGAILLAVRNKINLFSTSSDNLSTVTMIFYLLIGLVVGSIIIQDSAPVTMAPNIVIFAMATGSVWLSYQTKSLSKWDWIKPDIFLSLVILLGFSAFGSFITGVYAVALLGMGYLLGSRTRIGAN